MSVYVLFLPLFALCIIPPFYFPWTFPWVHLFYVLGSLNPPALLPTSHSFCNHTLSFSCLRRLTKLRGIIINNNWVILELWNLSFVCGRPTSSFARLVDLLFCYTPLFRRAIRTLLCECECDTSHASEVHTLYLVERGLPRTSDCVFACFLQRDSLPTSLVELEFGDTPIPTFFESAI